MHIVYEVINGKQEMKMIFHVHLTTKSWHNNLKYTLLIKSVALYD